MSVPIVRVESLRVTLRRGRHEQPLVRGIDLEVGRNEVVAVLGETGAGKSLTGWAIGRLLRSPLEVTADRLEVVGLDVVRASTAAVRDLRRHQLAYVVQNPRSSLEPVRTCGRQLVGVVRRADGVDKATALARAGELLDEVGVRDPEAVLGAYPHELSGGLAQRVVIAMALASKPKLLIADEPTSSLDVTVQAQILTLLERTVCTTDLSVLLITHDIGIARHYCNRAYVMQHGEVVEHGPAAAVLDHPKADYTKHLLASAPQLDDVRGDEPGEEATSA